MVELEGLRVSACIKGVDVCDRGITMNTYPLHFGSGMRI